MKIAKYSHIKYPYDSIFNAEILGIKAIIALRNRELSSESIIIASVGEGRGVPCTYLCKISTYLPPKAFPVLILCLQLVGALRKTTSSFFDFRPLGNVLNLQVSFHPLCGHARKAPIVFYRCLRNVALLTKHVVLCMARTFTLTSCRTAKSLLSHVVRTEQCSA